MSQYSVSFSVYSDAKSPFWLAQLVRADGSRVKRSTYLRPTPDQLRDAAGRLAIDY